MWHDGLSVYRRRRREGDGDFGCVVRGLLALVVTVLTAVGMARWFVGV